MIENPTDLPIVALTMGDVAGVGPELIARAWVASPLRELARPIVIGCAATLEKAVLCAGLDLHVERLVLPRLTDSSSDVIPCWNPTGLDLSSIEPGQVDPRAGWGSHAFLVEAIDLALEGRVDAITTLPLNKESLHEAGVSHPGHTEILAERCGVAEHGMMLYLGPPQGGPHGLGVLHATLHVPLRKVFELLTIESVRAKIELGDASFRAITGGAAPRIAVAGLNPHAGENGLFGDEERLILAPAVEIARSLGIDVVGPIAADTLFHRALGGGFDVVVAMYHDQGHVALKSVGFERAVNITLGLPIVRTSVAHGTAFDIAWRGEAETTSLIEAVRVAGRIVQGLRRLSDAADTAPISRPTPDPRPSK
ncbi:MAG: 4-hydroxythreonine-4-phosphate dehydrogenase PdxA [Isosphaeraceae bacterium]|nr:4-hydroxythreonine-4-phosphate dehydrogenase PdxA [Isosphaeraceae bacterium]